MSVTENGTWTVVDNSDIGGPVYLQSSDFTHDAGLTVGGDFSSHEQLLEYAEEMARRLNALTTKGEKLAGLVEAAEALLRRDELNTCQHENTHRGGGIWEICDDCGEKWSDDRNPKKKWRDPPEWVAVRAAIAAAKEGV